MTLLAFVALIAAVVPGSARAQDPGRWVETGHDIVPLEYFQGLTSDPSRNIYFDGLFVGLYRTDLDLNEAGAQQRRDPGRRGRARALQPHRRHHVGPA